MMDMMVHKTERAKKLGARYVLQVHRVNRTTGKPAPSIWWETRTQAEAYQRLLTILAVYNANGQPNFVEYATIETNRGKQVFASNLTSIYTH